MARISKRALLFTPAVIGALTLVGCGDSRDARQYSAPQLVSVGFIEAVLTDVGLTHDLPGRLSALNEALVMPQVSAIVTKRHFTEGSFVKEGDLLFTLESLTFEADLANAKAALARATAAELKAKSLLDKYSPLVAIDAVSRQDFENAKAAEAAAKADTAAAEATVRKSELILNHTQIRAPISGRIGKSLVSEGALVTPSASQGLALIQQTDYVYADVLQSSTDTLRLKKAISDGSLGAISSPVAQLLLPDGSIYAEAGEFLFQDSSVDEGTGRILLRLKFKNHDGLLMPGLFARVRITQSQSNDAFLVPQQAIVRSALGSTLSVLTDDSKVESRAVTVDRAVGNKWVVSEGLKSGERVVIDGHQKLQMLPPGASVIPVPWTPLVNKD